MWLSGAEMGELLTIVRRFIEKRGFETSYYSMSFGGGGPDFLVHKGRIRLGIVEAESHTITFHPNADSGTSFQTYYKYNIYDPNSLPLLVEQIKAILISKGGL
jgi:hypothetical protein